MISTKLYLDSRRHKVSDVKLVIRKNRTSSMVSLGVRVSECEWDKRDCMVVNRPDAPTLNAMIESKRKRYDSVLVALHEMGMLANLDAPKVKDLLLSKLDPTYEKKNTHTFFGIYKDFIKTKEGRTKEIYEATIKKIREYTKESLTFEKINFRWLVGFERHLMAQSLETNTIGIHMRNIRAIFNYAIKCEETTSYPFKLYSIKHAPTRKRNLSVEQMQFLWHYEAKEEWQQRYIDMFKLIFSLVGINMVDLLHSKELVNGRLEYYRSKTNTPISVKVEPEARELMDKLKGRDYLVYPMDTNKDYRHYTYRLIYGLRKFCQENNLPNLSSYWARHTWASIASELDIPKEVIGRSLGHRDSCVTDIYINFNKRKIDEANRRVLDYVIYGKR